MGAAGFPAGAQLAIIGNTISIIAIVDNKTALFIDKPPQILLIDKYVKGINLFSRYVTPALLWGYSSSSGVTFGRYTCLRAF
jgi:hypothetical protein